VFKSFRVACAAIFLFTIAVSSVSFAQATGTLMINEVMSSNLSSLHDEYEGGASNCRERDCVLYYQLHSELPFATYDGKYPDWIELYNPTDTAINLSGYRISDDPSTPNKWAFPEYTIPSKGYFVVFATGKDRKPFIPETVEAWESVITQGDEWRYLEGHEAPPSDWDSLDFDDSSWELGASGFGWGDDDDATVITSNPTSIYIRKEFYIEDINDVEDCVMHLDYDDGFLATMNGIHIAEDNIRVMDFTPVRYNTTALAEHEAQIHSGGNPDTFQIKSFESVLRTGKNVLAIRVHSKWSVDDDLTAIPFFSMLLSQPPQEARGIPAILRPLLMSQLPEKIYPHTNFRLSSSGETVVLTDPTGTKIDEIEVVPLAADFTYGRQPDGAGTLHVFHAATPEQANTTSPFPGFTDDPISMSPEGGFHSGSVTVELTGADPGSDIFYTLDGDEPTTFSEPYTGPFMISKSTAVRARAYRDGIMSSHMVTKTYILNYEPTMPVVSVTTTPTNLWNGDTGIYVEGNHGTRHYSNLFKFWERPCHVELYEVDGTQGIDQDAGVRLHGRASKFNALKGLALFARDRYGDDSFSYPVIPTVPQDEYYSFILRPGAGDWKKAIFRDLLGAYMVKDLNIDVMDGRPAVVFLNGEYWGIHNIREKQNEEYLEDHHNIDPDNVDLMELYHGMKVRIPPSVLEGTADNYNAMVDYLKDNDLNDPEVYEHVKSIIDIDSYLDHHVAGLYNANQDWMGNNYKCWRDRGPEGIWRFLYFDLDHAYGGKSPTNYMDNMVRFLTNPDGPKSAYPAWTTVIIRRLFTSDEFRDDFINRTADFLNTVFDPDRIVGLTEDVQAMYEPEMSRHVSRWSSAGVSRSSWDSHVSIIKTFARKRNPYIREHVIDYWDLGGTSEVTLDVSDAAGGVITISTVKPDAYPWSGTYFQNVPVEITALPNPGYAFAGWEGLEQVAKPAAWDAILTTTLPDSLSLTAVFEPSSDSMNSVVITEINHDSAADFGTGDWIELYNGYETPLDVSGWRIRDDDDIQSYVLPLHTTIDPGGYLVVAREVLAFTELFPGVTTVVGGFAFGFDGNDAVRLYDAAGDLVDIVNYDTGLYWPSGADGTGSTLGLRGTDLDNGTPDNWGVTLPNGTPGAPNTFTEGSLIVINEINYNPSVEVPSEDWVELYNTGAEAIDLSGWVLRDDNDDHTFTLPSGTMIDADGYLVLCRDAAAFAAVFPTVGNAIGSFIFGLSNNGDTVRLFDAGGVLVDVVVYDDGYPWPEASDGDGSTLSLKNPESDNGYFAHWVASTGSGTPGEQNDIYSVGVEDDAGMLPTVFALGQNYPNPFNGVTTIPFSLPGDEHVTATVHSLTGQRVATLIDARLEPGNHVVMFRPEGLASGIYLVHITAGNFRAGRRMVYIK
jgi:hypothetical protein